MINGCGYRPYEDYTQAKQLAMWLASHEPCYFNNA